jgi:exodeoxyribonuclease-3
MHPERQTLKSKTPLLRVVSWNCCRRRFAGAVEALEVVRADLALLQEVGRPTVKMPTNVWRGTNLRQGVAVVALSSGVALRAGQAAPADMMAPVRVKGVVSFDAINVWAHLKPTYAQHLQDTFDRFLSVKRSKPVLLAGDFNHNVSLDRPRKPLYKNVVARLREEFGLVSAYHHFHGVEHGREPHATYFHYRKQDRPFHIDFCFIPVRWVEKLVRVDVLDGEPWTSLSDHRPLVVEIRL